MKLDEFITIVEKVKSFKFKLERENIKGIDQQIVLKVYIADMTDKINTKYLKVV